MEVYEKEPVPVHTAIVEFRFEWHEVAYVEHVCPPVLVALVVALIITVPSLNKVF